MNFISSAIRAKASTSVKAFTVRVDGGKLEPALGSRAHVRSSSPQKSPSFKTPRLKNPLLPPSVVTLSRRPRIMKSISFTGSPSRTTDCSLCGHTKISLWGRRETEVSKDDQNTYPSHQIQTEVPLDISPEIMNFFSARADIYSIAVHLSIYYSKGYRFSFPSSIRDHGIYLVSSPHENWQHCMDLSQVPLVQKPEMMAVNLKEAAPVLK
ncbi:hypothetical protein RJ640_021380 [Escallonia rubra]|uniref:Uncharacterized protein n=1 Tax=Escallonia rubra TaxID=112253 RepID=A0AA88UIT5_9ASTE|nr:hypothetical protein RJ640_021380 [Escallonia rubra]